MERVKIVGDLIKNARKSQGFTQIDFAYECNIDKTNLGRIERGEVFMRLDTLILICDTLGVTISEFLKDI